MPPALTPWQSPSIPPPRPAVGPFIVDGASFARVRVDAVTSPHARPAATVVTGCLHNGDLVLMTCAETAESNLVRAGCEVVVGSLHVRQ